MKAKDPKKAHALLSASGSDRWLGCPGSARLSERFPPQDNQYSIAGTNAHTLMQFILENPFKWRVMLDSSEAKVFKDFIGYSQKQYESVMVAVRYVNGQRREMGLNTRLLIEKKVELEGVGFGTADIILYQPFGVLHVMDYKNGSYKIEPEDNTQGLYYAYGAADLFGWDFREVWITIIQPNALHRLGPIRTWKTTPQRLEQGGLQLRRGALATKNKNAPLIPQSKYCWFCPAKSICPEQVEMKNNRVMERFS